MSNVLLFPGIPGGIELMVVLLVVVLLFGANKVPQLARSSGQAMGEFKRGRRDVERELRAAAQSDSVAAEAATTVETDAGVGVDADAAEAVR
ncbi:MAG: twin-arginine translocase TatA/TatE family subunit [Haloferacaceae archaeon]